MHRKEKERKALQTRVPRANIEWSTSNIQHQMASNGIAWQLAVHDSNGRYMSRYLIVLACVCAATYYITCGWDGRERHRDMAEDIYVEKER